MWHDQRSVADAIGCMDRCSHWPVCRPVVVSTFWLRDQRSVEPWITVLFTSLTIGLFLGWLAGTITGSIRNPVIGTVWGAICGAMLGLVSSLFTIYFLCMATYQPHGGRDINVSLYLAAMVLRCRSTWYCRRPSRVSRTSDACCFQPRRTQ